MSSFYHFSPAVPLSTDDQCYLHDGHVYINPEIYINHYNTIEIKPQQCVYAVICNNADLTHTIGIKTCSAINSTKHNNYVCFRLFNTDPLTCIVILPGTSLDNVFSTLCVTFSAETFKRTQKYF